MDTLTYWNGTWHEGNPAILGPRDHAFWLGSMVFDGGRAFEGCGPDLDLHAERVVHSATALGLKPTKTADEILKLMHEGVRRFGAKAELYVRPMFWAMKGGPGPISVDADSCQFLLCVYHSPMRAGTPLTLGLCRNIRRPTPESAPTMAKASCLYPNSSRGVAEMLERGFQNGVVLDAAGNVAETCSSNIFLAKDGVVATPVSNGSFLAGTRLPPICTLALISNRLMRSSIGSRPRQPLLRLWANGCRYRNNTCDMRRAIRRNVAGIRFWRICLCGPSYLLLGLAASSDDRKNCENRNTYTESHLKSLQHDAQTTIQHL